MYYDKKTLHIKELLMNQRIYTNSAIITVHAGCGWLVVWCSTHAATVKVSIIKANIQSQQQKRYVPHRTVMCVSHNSNRYNVMYVGCV